jgi:acyl-CoA dehydrogenase
MNDLLSESVEKLLSNCATPDVVRQVEASGDGVALWRTIVQSGYLDALVPEASGGAGLTLTEIFPLLLAAGRHALPLPLSHTMLVRAALASHGMPCPDGAMAIAAQHDNGADGNITCRSVPYGRVVEWVVVPVPDGWLVLPTASAEKSDTGVHGSLKAHLTWRTRPAATLCLDGALDWRGIGAALTAAEMAGAMEHVLAITVAFANERVQFGRSIGKFQAIQQQLSVMVEQVFAARMAAQLGCSGAALAPHRLLAAAAKARAGDAAAVVAPIAHAVHGAMGITAEYALQIHTRRLHENAIDYGSAQYWNRQVGEAVLTSASASALDFIISELTPPNA